MSRRLGRIPSRRDGRTLQLTRYLPSGARAFAAPPLARDWSREVRRFGMFGNDRIGCCGLASIGHILQAQAANARRELLVTERDVVDAYRVVGNYDPAYPDTDNGVQMIDALKYWRSVGVAGVKIDAFVQLETANRLHAELGVNLFGAVYVGADLPLAAQQQTIWDVAPPGSRDKAYDRNSWGPHAMAMVGYSRTAVVLVTWGAIKLATWEWFYAYVSEAWAAACDLWADGGRLAPSGFDRAQLDADLAVLA